MSVLQYMDKADESIHEKDEDVVLFRDKRQEKVKLFMGHQKIFYIQESLIEDKYSFIVKQEDERTAIFPGVEKEG